MCLQAGSRSSGWTLSLSERVAYGSMTCRYLICSSVSRNSRSFARLRRRLRTTSRREITGNAYTFWMVIGRDFLPLTCRYLPSRLPISRWRNLPKKRRVNPADHWISGGRKLDDRDSAPSSARCLRELARKHMFKTMIVVPCHNEARRLDLAAFRRIVRQSSDVGMLFVNDGSSDETHAVLSRIAAENPARFRVVDLKRNVGKAEAVRRGVLRAAADGPQFVGFWDADLATPLTVIDRFVDVLVRRAELSVVVGVRLPLLGHAIHRRPVRGWLGAEFARIASLAFGQRLQDTQCGAKLFRVTPETIAAFSEPFASRWIFDVELLARLRQLWCSSKTALRECVNEYPLD